MCPEVTEDQLMGKKRGLSPPPWRDVWSRIGGDGSSLQDKEVVIDL